MQILGNSAQHHDGSRWDDGAPLWGGVIVVGGERGRVQQPSTRTYRSTLASILIACIKPDARCARSPRPWVEQQVCAGMCCPDALCPQQHTQTHTPHIGPWECIMLNTIADSTAAHDDREVVVLVGGSVLLDWLLNHTARATPGSAAADASLRAVVNLLSDSTLWCFGGGKRVLLWGMGTWCCAGMMLQKHFSYIHIPSS